MRNYRHNQRLTGSMRCLLGASLASFGMLVGTAQAQLLSSWAAPLTDDGASRTDPVNSWVTDVTTGEFFDAPTVIGTGAAAADNALGRLYVAGNSLFTYVIDESGALTSLGEGVRIQDANGVKAERVAAMGFARGVIYAYLNGSKSGGLEAGLYAISPATAIATPLMTAPDFPFLPGFDYNPADGLMYGVVGSNTDASIVSFDLDTFTVSPVAAVPLSAYGGLGFSFEGVAVGNGKVYLVGNKTGSTPIAVYDLASGTFEENLPGPIRTSENSFYRSGATFFPAALGADLNPGPPSAPQLVEAKIRRAGADPADKEVALTWARNPEEDFDHYVVYRSTDGVEFVEIGTTTSERFGDADVGAGVTYSYFVTAVDQTGLESEPSETVSVTLPAAPEQSMAVSAIKPKIKTDKKGRNRGRVVVTIVDQAGVPVPSATVTVTFSGSYNETLSKATNTKGKVRLTTAARLTGPVAFDVCVDSVELDGRTYDPANNVETCDSFSSF